MTDSQQSDLVDSPVEVTGMVPSTNDTGTRDWNLMPVYDGEAMVLALTAYRELQAALDADMPEAIVDVKGKKFRKKVYWRTIARAFSLSVGEVQGSEEMLTTDAGDWGYKVTYRAIHSGGAYADGDGACMASEKFGDSDTVHNVRSHAHTRAFNRATSNLVGFGEVSADELVTHEGTKTKPGKPNTQAKKKTPQKPREAGGEPFVVTSKVADLTTKTGTGRKGEWRLFIIKLTSGESGTTFDEDLHAYAESCHQREVLVEATFQTDGDYTNLIGLEETRSAGTQHTDAEPENGESPLTIEDVPF